MLRIIAGLLGIVVSSQVTTSPANDAELAAECQLELGIALVHAVQSHDDEGAVVLGSAVAAASEANLDGIASRALAELGYVDVLAGRRVTAALHLEWARELAGNDQALLAAVASIEGTDFHDRGLLDLAAARYRESIQHAIAAGKTRRHAWALGAGARTLYSQGEYKEAREWVEVALDLVQRERWTAFRPWVEAWRGQTDLKLGRDPADIIAELESTYALSCQLKDACWQGMSAKVMGLAHAASGDRAAAESWLTAAAAACARETDAYVWVRGDVALAHAELALEWNDHAMAAERAEDAILIAARCGLDGILAKASRVRSEVRDDARVASAGA